MRGFWAIRSGPTDAKERGQGEDGQAETRDVVLGLTEIPMSSNMGYTYESQRRTTDPDPTQISPYSRNLWTPYLDGWQPECGALAAVPLDEGGEGARLRQALHHRVEEARVAKVGHPAGLGDQGAGGTLGPALKGMAWITFAHYRVTVCRRAYFEPDLDDGFWVEDLEALVFVAAVADEALPLLASTLLT